MDLIYLRMNIIEVNKRDRSVAAARAVLLSLPAFCEMFHSNPQQRLQLKVADGMQTSSGSVLMK